MIIRLIGLSAVTLCLSACMIDGTSNYSNISPFGVSEPSTMLYPEGYDAVGGGMPVVQKPIPSSNVVVPQSYHVGMGHPESSKHADKNWVDTQNPQGYTIELANSDKASRVANVLYKAPKTERTAEVKAYNGSYKGLYGSYPTYEAAQAQLNSLPDDLKQNADIKTWSNIQRDLQ